MTHPLDGEVYTPMTTEVTELLMRMRLEYSRWHDIAAISGLRSKQVRSLRDGKHANGDVRKTVSYTTLDKLITATAVGQISDYPWYTPSQLIEMGIWEPNR
jgi:hypothetical protein